jgi:hypothetical protein
VTHTFTKNDDGTYTVGMWLLSFHRPGTHQFTPLIKVEHLRSAIRLTNLLNGGTGNIEATLLRAGALVGAEEVKPNNGEDHESTAKSAAMVRRARGRAVPRHTV